MRLKRLKVIIFHMCRENKNHGSDSCVSGRLSIASKCVLFLVNSSLVVFHRYSSTHVRSYLELWNHSSSLANAIQVASRWIQRWLKGWPLKQADLHPHKPAYTLLSCRHQSKGWSTENMKRKGKQKNFPSNGIALKPFTEFSFATKLNKANSEMRDWIRRGRGLRTDGSLS